jgi:hypothetical protein
VSGWNNLSWASAANAVSALLLPGQPATGLDDESQEGAAGRGIVHEADKGLHQPDGLLVLEVQLADLADDRVERAFQRPFAVRSVRSPSWLMRKDAPLSA